MVYFDFDGTLTDVWERFYRIFLDASAITGITLDAYIRAKKQFPQDGELAAYFGAELPKNYREKKRSMLEDPEYLAFDRLIVPAQQLCGFFERHDCRILTNRRNPQNFKKQLTALGLDALQDRCIILNPDEKISKSQFLQKEHPNEKVILVGDAEAESQAAQLGSVQVWMVRTGLRAPETMPFSDQCEMIDSVSDFMNAFKESV